MTRSVPGALALPWLLLASLAPATAGAQDPVPEADALFGETVDVRVVNVEAVVHDRSGVRVTGLGPGDFRLLVDGEPTPIDYFSEIAVGAAVVLEGSGVPGIPAAPVGEPVGVSYLVFVDDFFSMPYERDRVLRSMAEDLDRLGPADRMAIVAFDGTRLDRLAGWTGSREELGAALERAVDRPAHGLARRGELRAHDELRERPRPRRADPLRTEQPEDRILAVQLREQLRRSIDAATASLRHFGQPPGRKVALLLSGGWPISPGAFAAGSGDVITVDADRGSARLIEPLVDTANLLGYTLYPVDVPGLRPNQGSDIERHGRWFDDTGVFIDTPPIQTVGATRERERLEQDSLYLLASRTGGRAFLGGTGRKALAGAAADTASYYWIGFTPDRRRDDRPHEIRLETVNPDLAVRARDGFRDLSRRAEQEMALASSLLFGAPGSAAELELEVEAIEPRGRKEADLMLIVRIPLDEIELIPEGGGWVGRLEIRAGAIDEKRRDSELPSAPYELRFPEEPLGGSEYVLRLPLLVRRAPQTIVVHVSDAVGGRTLSYRTEVAP